METAPRISGPVDVASPRVRAGSILCFRLVDISDEVLLEEAERLLRTASVRRTHLGRRETHGMDFVAVPLTLDLARRTLTFPQNRRQVEVESSVHVFAHGTISVCFQIP